MLAVFMAALMAQFAHNKTSLMTSVFSAICATIVSVLRVILIQFVMNANQADQSQMAMDVDACTAMVERIKQKNAFHAIHLAILVMVLMSMIVYPVDPGINLLKPHQQSVYVTMEPILILIQTIVPTVIRHASTVWDHRKPSALNVIRQLICLLQLLLSVNAWMASTCHQVAMSALHVIILVRIATDPTRRIAMSVITAPM